MAFHPQFLDEIRTRIPLSDIVGKQVRLQHAPPAHGAVRRHHVRVVSSQVPLQVADAVVSLLAHPVLLLAALAVLRHAEAGDYEKELLLVALVDAGS